MERVCDVAHPPDDTEQLWPHTNPPRGARWGLGLRSLFAAPRATRGLVSLVFIGLVPVGLYGNSLGPLVPPLHSCCCLELGMGVAAVTQFPLGGPWGIGTVGRSGLSGSLWLSCVGLIHLWSLTGRGSAGCLSLGHEGGDVMNPILSRATEFVSDLQVDVHGEHHPLMYFRDALRNSTLIALSSKWNGFGTGDVFAPNAPSLPKAQGGAFFLCLQPLAAPRLEQSPYPEALGWCSSCRWRRAGGQRCWGGHACRGWGCACRGWGGCTSCTTGSCRCGAAGAGETVRLHPLLQLREMLLWGGGSPWCGCTGFWGSVKRCLCPQCPSQSQPNASRGSPRCPVPCGVPSHPPPAVLWADCDPALTEQHQGALLTLLPGPLGCHQLVLMSSQVLRGLAKVPLCLAPRPLPSSGHVGADLGFLDMTRCCTHAGDGRTVGREPLCMRLVLHGQCAPKYKHISVASVLWVGILVLPLGLVLWGCQGPILTSPSPGHPMGSVTRALQPPWLRG